MDGLDGLRVFSLVAELRSFSAAASRLNLSPAMASKHVMSLEERLGLRLFNRTSRHVSLTEPGLLYFNYVKQMLDGLGEIEAGLSNIAVMPRGTLKITAPMWAANAHMAHVFARYHERFPEVVFDIDLSGRYVNLVEEGFDLALRVAAPGRLSPGLVARPLTTIDFRLMATPGYLTRVGRPERLADLEGSTLLLYSGSNLTEALTFEGPDGSETVKFNVVMQSQSETMLHLAALQSMGLVFLPLWNAQEDLAHGRLEIVLPDQARYQATLYAVYPSRKYLAAKVRTFVDFLVSESKDC